MSKLSHKNFINFGTAAFFTASILFMLSVISAPACFAYEVVEAETKVIEKPEADIITPQYSLRAISGETQKRQEFYIPNPLDEIILKKIKESNRGSKKAAQNEPKKSDITIDSRELEYFDEIGELEARGNVTITSSSGTIVTADRAVYDKNSNTVKLFDNVILRKEDNVVKGEYMVINLNEENALIDAPLASVGTMIRVRAQEGYAYTDRIEAVNGDVDLAKKIEMRLQTSGFNGYDNMLIQDDEISFDIKRERLSPYKIRTKEIVVQSEKDHDSVAFKNADLYYKKLKIATIHNFELFSDKEMNYVEANIPVDIGSISNFGQYAGMGYIFKIPNGGNLKVLPALVYDNDLGVGVLGNLRTKRLNLEAAWATSSENLIVDGRYNFTNKLWADFARHAYKDEGFVGSKRPGHLAQLSFGDSYPVDDIQANFKQRFDVGYVSEYLREHQERDNFGTMRFRWQAELNKEIYEISNKEQDMSLNFGVTAQTMETVYGTGETTAIARFGPYIASRIKNWKSRISYKVAGVHGKSPFEFDEYTYGKSTIEINESLKLSKYLSVGYRGNISPLKDNSDDDLLTENRFYVVAGPEDIKVAFSYDITRSNVHLDFMFLLGTDTTDITFDKMTIKDPDKMGKKEASPIGSDWKYRKVKVPDNL